MSNRNGGPTSAYLKNIEEAAEYLNVPEGWLRKKVTQRAVRFTKIGKHVRFTPEHLEAIIRAGESAPTPTRSTARTRL